MNELVRKLVSIAAEAAKIVERIYATPFTVDYKAPRDPVTEADRLANELICRRLKQEFPGVPVVAEESLPETFNGYRSAERVFFVDPVDGTREFVERNGEFAIMIGLLEADVATTGVIHAPALGRVWAGRVGEGAWLIEQSKQPEPIRVSQIARLADASIVASRSHRSAVLEAALQHLGARQMLTLGSAGLKGAEVARGAADAYFSPFYAGKRWDACATDALVVAAGGKVSDGDGKPIDYRGVSLSNDRGLIASNGLIHDAIIAKAAERG